MTGDSAKPYPLLLGDTQGDLGSTADSAPPLPLASGDPPSLLSRPFVLEGPGYLEDLENFPTLVDTALSLWGGDGVADLGCQGSPAPGHVYLVEAEESAPMMRADSGHWAKDKATAPQASGKEGRQRGKVSTIGSDGVEAGLTGSHIPYTCPHIYMLTPPHKLMCMHT